MKLKILSKYSFGLARAQDEHGACHVKKENGKIIPAYETRFDKVREFKSYEGFENQILSLVKKGPDYFYIDQNGQKIQKKASEIGKFFELTYIFNN